jgi:hypothetical protein
MTTHDFVEESDDLTAESFMSALHQKVLQWPEKDSEPHQTNESSLKYHVHSKAMYFE